MFVVFSLSALLKVCRSNSVYRSFSALAALIQFTDSNKVSCGYSGIYVSFAADGCIFHLETLALSLGDTCAEKEYLLALVILGRAGFITATSPKQRYDDIAMRTELRDAISLQQYVPSPPTQSYLILFLQSAQRRLACFRWKSVHRPCKSISFPLLVGLLSFLSHH